MLLIYRHETRMKTGYVVTEDLLPPEGGSYKQVRTSHPDHPAADRVMRAMSEFFVSTGRARRLTLKEAFEGALANYPGLADHAKYLPAGRFAERIIVQ